MSATDPKPPVVSDQNYMLVVLARNIAFALFCLVISSACVTNREYARFDPDSDIQPSDVFYVEQQTDDRRRLGLLIADNLSTRGFMASAGPADSVPDGATVLVTYEDRWTWDITMFLIEMTITLRQPTSKEAFASGTSYHTSMSRLNPAEMIDEIISNLLKADAHPDGLIQFGDSGPL
jgi:hypothetical protein